MAALDHSILVPTCIGCHARFRDGMCAGGCDDQPLDLVDTADLEALRTYVADLDTRVAGLRAVAQALAGDAPWSELQARARTALRGPRPLAPAAAEIVEAWGCPRCGRIDAPQPCIGVCTRVPVSMSSANELRPLAEHAARGDALDRALTAVVTLAAHTTPGPNQLDATRAAIAARARAALDADA